MSLWTPDGEVPIDRGADGPQEPPGAGGAPSLDDLSPEDRARAEEMVAQMAEVQRQILSVPASQIVTNHVVGFYELAAIHLGQPEPDLEAARLAVDAMTAVLQVAGDRLGEDGAALRQALTQLQVAFVEASGQSAGGAGQAEGSSD